MTLVDPSVFALAVVFVDDLLRVYKDALVARQASLLDERTFDAFRGRLIERTAGAMQQAIEAELADIERELLS